MTDGAHNLDPCLFPDQGGADDQPGSPSEAADSLRFDRRRGVTGSTGDRRRSVVDRRTRPRSEPADDAGVAGTARMRGAGRRLADSLRSAEEGELTREQFLFVMAVDAFKRENQVSFPAWTDVLEIVRLLGYRKTQACELRLRNAEDWTEKPDSPSNVRPKGFEERRAA